MTALVGGGVTATVFAGVAGTVGAGDGGCAHDREIESLVRCNANTHSQVLTATADAVPA